jgi:hypothetical protein
MKIINNTVYLQPNETFGARKKIKQFDSTGLLFGKEWSKKNDQLRNQGKLKKAI